MEEGMGIEGITGTEGMDGVGARDGVPGSDGVLGKEATGSDCATLDTAGEGALGMETGISELGVLDGSTTAGNDADGAGAGAAGSDGIEL